MSPAADPDALRSFDVTVLSFTLPADSVPLSSATPGLPVEEAAPGPALPT